MKSARNVFWAFSGLGSRTIVQALYFILLARVLGPTEYGALSASLAIIYIFVPYATWGSDSLLVRNVARQRETFNKSWGYALLSVAIFGSVFLLFSLALYYLLLADKVSILPVILLCLSELFFTSVVNICISAYQAFEIMHRTALLQFLFSMVRFSCTLLFVFMVKQHSLINWVYLYLASTGLTTMFCLSMVCIELGRPRFAFNFKRRDLVEGFYFSLSSSSENAYNNLDKSILPKYATLGVTGSYSAAYKIIDALCIPIRSLLFTFWPKFFQKGEGGLDTSKKFALRLLPVFFIYSVVAVLLTIIFSKYVLVLFGNAYKEMIYIIPLLSPIIVFRSFHTLGADALTGAGLQGWRSAIQIIVAILNAILCFILIPTNGWLGAVWASLLSDGIMAILIWGFICCFSLAKKSK